MRLLSRSSIAGRLDISEKTLDRWVETGKFPPPTHFVPERSQERWLEAVLEIWLLGQTKPIPKTGQGQNEPD